ncbi:PDR/VanB family oxidoreductase, partial [Methylibium sp. T29-B]|uniref:PDR/VanB family oxidoreductase n=2 Tax=unclassified Methylibium TaxID=2633235 RepID=UPI000561C66F
RETAAEGVASFVLRRADGGPLPTFDAGAHIDVELPNGMVRQYSLCNRPGETQRYCIGVLREAAGRGGSRCAHEALHESTPLRISAPKNHFPLVPAKHSILLAGGIGVTPILAMAETLTAADASFEMHYCTRSRARTAFAERIAAAPYALRVAFHHDDGAKAQKFDAKAVLAAPAADTHLYVCGPKGYMDHVIATAKALGWADAQIHFEYFAGGPVDHGADDAFEIELATSGRVVTVPAGQTVIAALAAQGVEVPVSCEQGVCGTCILKVVGGTPDHRDMYFSDAEHAANDQFTPCCSRSKTPRLVVAL